MKFSDLKNAVAGKTVLVDEDDIYSYFIGYFGDLVVVKRNGIFLEMSESQIKNWKIKEEKKLYWQWLCKTSGGNFYDSSYYLDERGRHPNGAPSSNELIRKIGKPIDENGDEVDE